MISLCTVLFCLWQSLHICLCFLIWTYRSFHQYSVKTHQYVNFIFLCSAWSCKFLMIFFWLIESLTTYWILMFLLSHLNSSAFWTKYFRIFFLKIVNAFLHKSVEHCSVIRYLVMNSCFFEYLNNEFSTDCQRSLDFEFTSCSALIR